MLSEASGASHEAPYQVWCGSLWSWTCAENGPGPQLERGPLLVLGNQQMSGLAKLWSQPY